MHLLPLPPLPQDAEVIEILDMHTSGEPVRILDARRFGLGGDSILAHRREFARRFDGWRRALMLEPRGHGEMYGAILVPPSLDGSDAAVLFCHNSGYSTMCGHATIALGRMLADQTRLAGQARDAFTLECPCGPVRIAIGPDGAAGFDAVPSFSAGIDQTCVLEGYGTVRFDIGYGGAFYAIVSAAEAGLDLATSPVRRIADFAAALVAQLRETRRFEHPDEADLSFLYGAIVTDGLAPSAGGATRNLCWFGEGQIDRSPTGSGVSARLAVAAARGAMAAGESCRFAGPAGQWFDGRITALSGNRTATHVAGRAFYTGTSRFVIEPADPLGRGFAIAETLPPLDQAD